MSRQFLQATLAVALITAFISRAHAQYSYITLNVPGATETYATGINSNNIVGYYYDGSTYHGFLYNGSTYGNLNVPGASGTFPLGISGNNITGYYTSKNTREGFLYNGSTYLTLSVPGTSDTIAGGIDGNSIVGYDYNNSIYQGNGFIYNSGSYSEINVPGATGTHPFGISGGNIVGWYNIGSSFLGFLYNGNSYSALNVQDATLTEALGISGNDIVGFYYNGATYQGFLYDTTNYTTLSVPGASNTYALGISDGNIVGYYTDTNGNFYGFLATPIIVTTLSATNVGNLSANLNGSVSGNGLNATTAYFQYGVDTSYGSTTAIQNISDYTNGLAYFTANISGLAPNTIYHYQAVAVTGGATSYGDDRTVTTQPSLLALASLSADAYSDFPEGYFNFGQPSYGYIGGYSYYVGPNAPDGFSVNAYSSADNSQVVVAYRGTVPTPNYTGIFNVIADYGFPSGTPNAELELYASAARQFVQNVQQQYTNANITLTGHSLGGALAQLVGNASGLTAIAFNAPGSASVYKDLQLFLYAQWPTQTTINPNQNYRIDGDQVSLAGTNFSSVITLASPYSLPPLSGSPLLYLLSNASTICTIHSIETVSNQIAANAQQTNGIPDSDPDLVPIIYDTIQPILTNILNGIQSASDFSFSVNISSDALINVDQSGGSDFVFSEGAESPTITAVDLPSLSGVSSYAVRSETGSTWSAFQSVPPATQYSFDAVNAIEIVPLDQNGKPVTGTNFVFGLYFASSGTVSASLIQSSVAPALQPALQIALAGNQLNLVWNTNFATGLNLVSTTNLALPILWVPVTNSPSIVSNQAVVNLPIVNQDQYFRLSQ